MARRRCSRCPRWTNRDRLLCKYCDPKIRTIAPKVKAPAPEDLSAEQIEATYQAALARIQARRRAA